MPDNLIATTTLPGLLPKARLEVCRRIAKQDDWMLTSLDAKAVAVGKPD